MVIAVTPSQTFARIEISRDEDWYTELPQFLENGLPIDLRYAELDLYVRPHFNHAVLFRHVSSYPRDGTRGIVLDDAANGMAHIHVPRERVLTDLPIGEWDHFMVLTDYRENNARDLDLSVISRGFRELWRGDFIVHASRL